MKVRITHLSAHQNAKVLAVLMAVFSLIIVIPMLVVFYFAPTVDQHGNPVPQQPFWLPVLFPIFYLIGGYLMTGLMCLIYNLIIKYVGGFEFDTVPAAESEERALG